MVCILAGSTGLCLQGKTLAAVCMWRRRSDGIRNKIRSEAEGENENTVPGRDRVMGFGKHKGKMLGTLPSTYLKWVSKNLRAREFEEWAILADQVLEDPVYQDRIQWEFAHNILTGAGRTGRDDVVSELLEISDRFGWDWENKSGWRDVEFELLGTSKGGRIPRRIESTQKSESKTTDNVSSCAGGGGGGRRRERRNRLRVKREKSKGAEEKSEVKTETENPTPRFNNPFPGRQTLLNRFTTTKSHLFIKKDPNS
ncbi:uncharacterized protein LOC120086315 [Benincasa hispida]|uniref:uncharacterized protein LOC120086315 n=1 Tax=Benincasa hispida TaxID=102211 RepID=UPI0019029295|nr:uncharacterized protein LOC120086315 [Benincasa hispida]